MELKVIFNSDHSDYGNGIIERINIENLCCLK